VVFGYTASDAGGGCPFGADVASASECDTAAHLVAGKEANVSSTDPCTVDDGSGAKLVCRKVAAVPLLQNQWNDMRGRRQLMEARFAAWARGDAPSVAPGRPQRVAAGVAVHPPKFYGVGRLLAEWASCPAAVQAMSIFLVFSEQSDLELFKRAQECLNPNVPHSLWTGVVSNKQLAKGAGGNKQDIAAWKKWHSIAAMMDMDEEVAPEYGLMLDAEVVLYHKNARPASAAEAVCTEGGLWSRLVERIRAMEASKAFPAARVSPTLTSYPFGNGVMNGKIYDTILIGENARFVSPQLSSCKTEGCQRVQHQIRDCLFSWWTDLPWVNVKTARRLFSHLAKPHTAEEDGGWQALSKRIHFPRFEYISYQQYCVIYEGFRFDDVTNITGEAKWGSYLEDPQSFARLDLMKPMWISMEALDRVQKGVLKPLNEDEPPLLIFHADHEGCRIAPALSEEKALWETLLLELLKCQGRSEFNKDNMKL